MLTLNGFQATKQGAQQGTTPPSPPKYICIKKGITRFGRAYKTDVKLLYSWISRSHFQISRVDQRYFVDTSGQANVFVNNEKVSFRALSDGDSITITSIHKDLETGRNRPNNGGPYLEYIFSSKARNDLPEGDVYKEHVFTEDQLIVLDDFVNGRMVQQKYSSEDFNGTEIIDLSDMEYLKKYKDSTNKPSSSCSRPTWNLRRSCTPSPATTPRKLSTSQSTSKCRTESPSKQAVKKTPSKIMSPNKSDKNNNAKSTEKDCDKSTSIAQGRAKRNAKKNLSEDFVSSHIEKSNPVKGKGKTKKPKVVKSYVLPLELDANGDYVPHHLRPNHPNPSRAMAKEYGISMNVSEQGKTDTVSSGASAKNSSNISDKASATASVPDTNSTIVPDKSKVRVTNKSSANISDKSSANGSDQADSVKMDAVLKPDKTGATSTQAKSNKTNIQTNGDKASNRKSMRERSKPISYIDNSDSEQCDESPRKKPATETKPITEIKPTAAIKSSTVSKSQDKILSAANTSKGKGKKRKANDDEDWDITKEKSALDLVKDGIVPKGRKKAKPTNKQLDFTANWADDIRQWHNPPIPKKTSKKIPVLECKRYHADSAYLTDKELFEFKDKGEEKKSLLVNVALLEYKVRHNLTRKDDMESFFRLMNHAHSSSSIDSYYMDDFDLPQKPISTIKIEQPASIKLELKDYQLSTLSWMMEVENKVGKAWTVPQLISWEEFGSDLVFDLDNKQAFVGPVSESPITHTSVQIKGGILADQMGLGKTITLLALVCSNPAPEDIFPDRETFDCYKTPYLNSRATLVAAPSHLTGQWKEEIETHAPHLKVALITTKTLFEKYSYADLMVADVVIVSVQFLLTNNTYKNLPSGRDATFNFINLMKQPGTNPLLKTGAVFEHINWWRIVCDEGHEIITYTEKYDRKNGNQTECSKGLQTMSNLKSNYRWYVTGTPFPDSNRSLKGALKFLELKVDDSNVMDSDDSMKLLSRYGGQPSRTLPIIHLVRDQFYVRNTKESVGREYDVPEYVEELILLTMSEVEKGIYERSTSQLEMRQLCCHLQISARLQAVAGIQQKSQDEIRKALIDKANKDIESCRKSIENSEKEIKSTRQELRQETKAHMKRLYEDRLNRYQNTVKTYKKEIEKHENAINYFEGIVPRIQHSADEPCVICLDDIQNLTVTPCGHLFCRTCIVSCVKNQNQCPTCRQPISESRLITVKDAKGKEELRKNIELDNLTEKYGTKMAYLIFYLRNLFHDDPMHRVIVFSQWDSLLHKIGDTLMENNIRNVFVKGNVHVRNRAISSFRKQETTRVIMLSLENAASGTNLVEATHVVLIDPIAENKEKAVAVEAQAIGRAHRMGQDKEIKVVRMIMKDTIEHELYQRNNSDSIQQVEFNFEQSNQFGGPQIVRKKMSMPKVDPAVLRQMAQASTTTKKASRRRGGFGARGRFVMMSSLGMMGGPFDDGPSRYDDYDDYEDYERGYGYGSDSDDERGNDCCIM